MTLDEFLSVVCPATGTGRRLARRKDVGRKLRLFACANVRRAWPVLTDVRLREAVEVAERYADGLVTREALIAACDATVAASGPGRLYGPQDSDERRAVVAAVYA